MLATRMRMAIGADFYPYKINQSCRFNDDDSAGMTDVQAVWTGWARPHVISVWVKRCNLGIHSAILGSIYTPAPAAHVSYLTFTNTDQLMWYHYQSPTDWGKLYTPKYRDVNSWYHIFLVCNTTLATAADRVKTWVNGEEITDLVTTDYGNIGQNLNLHWYENNVNDTRYVGQCYNTSAWYYPDCYFSDFQIVQGDSISVTDFGQFKNGIWIPKRYTGSYLAGSFHLDFADSAALGNDVSGNNNDFTSSGLTSDDKVLDSPTNNYPILNVLDKTGGTFSNGNLKVVTPATNEFMGRATEIVNPNVKTYFEVTLTVAVNSPMSIGFREASAKIGGAGWGNTYDRLLYTRPGSTENGKVWDGSSWSASYGTPAQGDVIGFAIYDNKWWIAINNSWVNSGDPAAGTGYVLSNLADDIMPAWWDESSSSSNTYDFNFGQLGFTYTPPTGYKALCSKYISTPTIKDSATGFDVITYTGNGAVRNITDLSFQPDLIWTKNRDVAYHHVLQDSVRGFSTNKKICSNDLYIENAPAIDDQYGYISAVSETGYTINKDGSGTIDWAQMNKSGEDYVAWCFKMGVNFGFDIQTYTGTGVAHTENHNLGGVPELMMVKNLGNGQHWCVYHHHALNKTDPETDRGVLDLSSAWLDNIIYWNDTAPTSTQFTVGTGATTNHNTFNFIAYLWRSIEGFSKVFSYTGNGNADGPFVYCGFRPRYIMIKKANAVGHWVLLDAERSSYNPAVESVYADLTNAEIANTYYTDILSNGFKLRGTHADFNTNAALYVGIAYAEQPGKYSNSR